MKTKIKIGILKILFKIKRNNFFNKHKFFKDKEYSTLNNNLKYSQGRLKEILLYSWENVPYYKKILEEAQVVKKRKIYLKNFNKIPALTKEIIRKEFENLKSKKINEIEFSDNASGGSTGEPTAILQDKGMGFEDLAFVWLQNSFVCDYPCKHLKLWGSERDIFKKWEIKGRLSEWLYSIKTLNSFRMTKENMKDYVNQINKYKPDIIEAYVQSIYELAKFIKKNNLEVYSPKGIITSAGILYPETRKLIEEVFRTKVFNRYGSREAPALACSCRENDKLHLNIFTHYIEILDKNLNPCKPGQTGEVYVTILNNYSMPLIRYKMEDRAVVASKNKKCSCGRGMPLIENIVGRTVSVLKTKTGALIDGCYFNMIFFRKNWIEKFQVVQEDYEKITLNIVLNGEQKKQDMKEIEHKIKFVFGKKCKVTWNFVKEIEPSKSGKFLYTISKVK